jgi:hypothetical protein
MNARTLISATVVSLCLPAGGVLLAAPAALAVTPPVVEEASVLDVAGTSATFHATINPQESETTYRFEYGTSASYGSSVPVPDGLVGSGATPIAVSAHPQDLLPSTTYHFRVVALVASRSEAVPGADGTFTTQPAGREFVLPDGRQWELVSPPNKHGARIYALKSSAPTQASTEGSRIAYQTDLPTELEPAGYGSHMQVMSARGAQGWSTRDISPQHASTASIPSEYTIFADDLSLGLLGLPSRETLLSSEASEQTPYIRHESLCDTVASASECYQPLVTDKEGFADVPPGTTWGKRYIPVAGATPDLRHVVLYSTEPNSGEVREIYEWSAGAPASEALQLVSLMPASEGGGPAEAAVTVGVSTGNSTFSGSRHSIANDGSRIFWVAETPGNGHKLYMRDTARKETVRLDVQQPGVPSGGAPYVQYQIASSDGSKVFFTDFDQEQRLTAQSGEQGQDLYECEIVEEAGKLKCNLTDLTPETGGESAEVQNLVLGASEDGSYVYFVANGVLGDGAEQGATQGTCKVEQGQTPVPTCNLYEYHNGAVTYIATLSQDDENNWAEENYTYREITNITARVSPDGRYLAFMSDRPLTGYDNRDAVSGLPDAEVYLYDAVGKHLVCASCNPTGSRPTGVKQGDFINAGEEPRPNIVDVVPPDDGGEHSFAANIPGGEYLNGGGQGTLYQPRVLSDGGRLFFNSSDALSSQDVNGQEDVYEFEPAGTGGCTSVSVTFNPKSGGCVALVSSGTSSQDSAFLDASEGGGDVFFMTTSRLTTQDSDTAYDVYDAHECSAAVPCVPSPVAPPPCDSGDSCKAAPAPQPSLFGAPSSETFSGAGNVVAAPSGPVVSGRSLTRAQKLAGALRACGKQPKRKRAVCRRRARRRYAGANRAVKAVRATSRTRG